MAGSATVRAGAVAGAAVGPAGGCARDCLRPSGRMIAKYSLQQYRWGGYTMSASVECTNLRGRALKSSIPSMLHRQHACPRQARCHACPARTLTHCGPAGALPSKSMEAVPTVAGMPTLCDIPPSWPVAAGLQDKQAAGQRGQCSRVSHATGVLPCFARGLRCACQREQHSAHSASMPHRQASQHHSSRTCLSVPVVNRT